MLIPNSEGVLKQLKIPVALIYISASVVLLLLVGTFFLSAEFFTDKVNEAELARLQVENEQLNEKYEQLRWNVSEIENRYGELVKKEIVIRNAFDMPEIDLEERQLGIGGPTSHNFDYISSTEKFALATEAQVDRLLRLSRFELEKYSEIEFELNRLQDRLVHTPSIRPTKGWYNRGFGMKNDPFTGYKRFHRGIDISNNTGTVIISSADGTVKITANDNDLGKFITIDHGYGFQTRYGHLSKIQVKRGQKVKRGDIIGLMGSTGYSTGPHLHYEVIRNGKFLNPRKYILN